MQSLRCWLYAKFAVLAICKVCGAGKTVRAGMLFCCAFACKKHPRTEGPMKDFCNRAPFCTVVTSFAINSTRKLMTWRLGRREHCSFAAVSGDRAGMASVATTAG